MPHERLAQASWAATRSTSKTAETMAIGQEPVEQWLCRPFKEQKSTVNKSTDRFHNPLDIPSCTCSNNLSHGPFNILSHTALNSLIHDYFDILSHDPSPVVPHEAFTVTPFETLTFCPRTIWDSVQKNLGILKRRAICISHSKAWPRYPTRIRLEGGVRYC